MTTALLALAVLATAAQRPSGEWWTLPLPAISSARAAPPRTSAPWSGSHIALELAAPSAAETAGSGPLLPVPLLIQMLDQESRARGLAVEIYRGAPPLLARGEPAALDALRERIEDLERSGQGLEIELAIGLEAKPPPARGSPATAGGAPTFTARILSGESASFGDRTATAFVAGWDVEVAEDSGVPDPVIGSVSTGRVVHLRASRIGGGSAILIEGVLDLSEVASVDVFDPGTSDLGVVQQPVVRSAEIVFAGAVQSGERLVVAILGAPLAEPDWTMWIQATTRPDESPGGPPDASSAGAGWALLDCALAGAAASALPPSHPGAGLGRWVATDAVSSDAEAVTPSAIAAAIESSRATGGSRTARAPLHWSTSLLFVPRADPDAVREARSFLAAAERAASDTRRVDVRRGGLRVSLPVTPGRPARVKIGTERTWLVDYSVEVAPESWMPSPEVERVFDGLSLDLVAEGEALACSGWIASSAAPADLDRGSAKLGRLQLPRRTFRGGAVRVRVGEGERTFLGSGEDAVGLATSARRP